MATAHPTATAPDRSRAAFGLAIGATLVTIALTGVAFWLSYEALHDLATGHHLTGSRAWAWPATLDAFVVVGELLVLRASLMRRVDWFALTLTGVGSFGSIALNVVSVGARVDLVTQIVAAVPPVAALLAFTALMRQLHRALARELPAGPTPRRTPVIKRTDAELTPVTVLPPMPQQPPVLLPIAYADPRCSVIRPLYNTGIRPGTRTMRDALTGAGYLGPDGRPLSDGTIRGTIRAEVEQHEPSLAMLPAEAAQLRAAP
ncbi:DUF2637 domain-containing protein [Kitasatospora sp. McL0602]|uniref:DUF2637 domain-containing protein n=1 Tax=Kitasatospora sp. McL0602 TaxID=3439530 RepID=UPI003F8A4D34